MASSNNLYKKRFGIDPALGYRNYGGGNEPSQNYMNGNKNGTYQSSRDQERDFAETVDLKKRSFLADEFGVKNTGRNNSCFLNAAL